MECKPFNLSTERRVGENPGNEVGADSGKLILAAESARNFSRPIGGSAAKNFPRTRTSEPARKLDSIPYRACLLLVVYDIIVFENLPIDLFSLYILFSQYRSCDNTPENCFFQISSYSRAYVRIIYKKTKDRVPLEPLLGKQNMRAKEVHFVRPDINEKPTISKLTLAWSGSS